MAPGRRAERVPAAELAGGRSEAIVGGEPAPPAAYNGVVSVATAHGEYSYNCTGTLIGPFHVLTAAHCVAGDGDSDHAIKVGLLSAPGPDFFTSATLEVPSSGCFVHPDRFPRSVPVAERTCQNLPREPVNSRYRYDVALLFLHPTSVRPTWFPDAVDNKRIFHRLVEAADAPNPLIGSDSWLGESLMLVGFGAQSLLSSAGTGTGRRRVEREIVALSASLGVLAGQPMVMLEGWFTGAPPSSGYIGAAEGDSGGPALSERPDLARPDRGPPIVGVAASYNQYASLLDPPVYEWLLERLDPDGDGIWEHPGVPTGGFDPRSNATNDLDGDGILDSMDNCPALANPTQLDQDSDDVGNLCDTCPTVYNPEQLTTDIDGDGVYDDCDSCPTAYNPLQEDSEVAPGFPPGSPHAVRTPDGVGDACDNCPTIANTAQDNCNEHAEATTGVLDESASPPRFGIGDACDPTPCGDTSMTGSTSWDGALLRWRRDRVRVRGIAAPANTAPLTTGFRYCVCPGAAGDVYRCELSPMFNGRDCRTGDADLYTSGLLDGQPTYQTISLPEASVVAYGPPDEPVDVYATTWWLPGDYASLATRTDIPVPDAKGTGVLWTHTFGAGVDDLDLSNHYLHDTFGQSSVAVPITNPCFDVVGPVFPGGPASFAGFASGFPPAVFVDLDCYPNVADFAAVFDGPEIGVFALPPGFGPDPLPFMSSAHTRWAFAHESGAWVPDRGIRYAALERDTGAIVGAIEADAAGYLHTRPIVTSPEFSLPPRSGYAATVSTRRSSLWLAGGADGAAHRTDLWRVGLDGTSAGLWRHVADLAVHLERIDGVAYSAVRDAVVVLGRSSGGAELRLVLVDLLDDNSVAVLDSWDRTGSTATDDELAAGPDGSLYLSVSLPGGHFNVLRRDPDGSLRGIGQATGDPVVGSLAGHQDGAYLARESGGQRRIQAFEAADMVPLGSFSGWL